MAKRKSKPATDSRPGNFLAATDALGLRAISYRRGPGTALECRDGQRRCLPRDLIGTDGKTLIVFREADHDYSIAGYEPWHDGMFGGRRESIESALAWVQAAREVRAGTRASFLGV